MSEKSYVRCDIDDRGVATVFMTRAEIHNAFDEQLIAELISTFQEIASDERIRVVVFGGEGKSFSAGADLNWMRRVADYSESENFEDAKTVAQLMAVIASSPKPVVARVHGAVFGGGVGLVSACDIAIGSDLAIFSLSEVKLGLIPATISPFVIRAIGARQAGRYMVSGERFGADEALRIGLLHKVISADDLDDTVENMVSELLKNGPQAMRESKELIACVMNRTIDKSIMDETAHHIARVRASDEGKEGLSAFLGKRAPAWLNI